MGLAGVQEEEEVELAQEPEQGFEQGLVRERAEEPVLAVRLLAAAAELQLTSGTAHKHRQNV